MNNCAAVLAFSAAAMLTATPAQAFKIDPLSRPEAILKAKHQHWYEHLSDPVHEQMSALSYGCAVAVRDGVECPAQLDNLQYDRFEDLAHGSRWNDDPNNQFPSRNGATWFFWLTDASVRKASLNKTFALLYRSHYGDLQVLHAMAYKNDTHGATQNKLLAWTQFAYDVAVGRINPQDSLGSLKEKYAFALNFAGTRKEQWSVRRLFLNINDFKGGQLDRPDEAVPAIALGALLHTIQDSYSRSHTTRDRFDEAENYQSGGVVGFLDYGKQDSNCHGAADTLPKWLAKGRPGLDGPVYHGAWVIRRVLAQAQWSEVEPYLRNVTFNVESPAGKSDGGAYGNCDRGSETS